MQALNLAAFLDVCLFATAETPKLNLVKPGAINLYLKFNLKVRFRKWRRFSQRCCLLVLQCLRMEAPRRAPQIRRICS